MAEPEFNAEYTTLPPADFTSDPRVNYNQDSEKWTYTDGQEGLQYEYDEERKAWFPMWNEQLIESQQSAYDHQENTSAYPEPSIPSTGREANIKRANEEDNEGDTYGNAKRPKPNAAPPPITSVYVTGLASDATVAEIAEVFGKFGIIMEDLVTGEPKIKIYTDKDGNPKGDGLVCYLKPESVELACELLDDTEFRSGDATKMRVQKAEFQQKPEGANKKKETLSAQEKKKLQKRKQKIEKKLDWFEAETGGKPDRFKKIVILKYIFTQKEIEEDVTLIIDLKDDIRSECERLGEVTNVALYDKTEDGVVSVRFKDPVSAEACVKLMNGRFFAGRRVTAEIHDGKTKYDKGNQRIPTTEEEAAEEKLRLEKYAAWLERQEREEREGREGVGQSGGDEGEEIS